MKDRINNLESKILFLENIVRSLCINYNTHMHDVFTPLGSATTLLPTSRIETPDFKQVELIKTKNIDSNQFKNIET